jgi:hypothetical protein
VIVARSGLVCLALVALMVVAPIASSAFAEDGAALQAKKITANAKRSKSAVTARSRSGGLTGHQILGPVRPTRRNRPGCRRAISRRPVTARRKNLSVAFRRSLNGTPATSQTGSMSMSFLMPAGTGLATRFKLGLSSDSSLRVSAGQAKRGQRSPATPP